MKSNISAGVESGERMCAAGRLPGPRIIVALDYDNAEAALAMAARLDPAACRLKVGKELFTAAGPGVVTDLVATGFEVFLDLKFHDIPNTVAAAVKAAADLGVWMVNVHASGGSRMMRAAREALASRRAPSPLLIAVTVLTSMDSGDLSETGIECDPASQVLRLARLARAAGLDGVVCSAREAALLRQHLGQDFCLVTPGIRFPAAGLAGERARDAATAGAETPGAPGPAAGDSGVFRDDQRRIVTPADALMAGSSYLVIGRPITRAPDPMAACREIEASIAELR